MAFVDFSDHTLIWNETVEYIGKFRFSLLPRLRRIEDLDRQQLQIIG